MKIVTSQIENTLAVITLLAHEARSMRLSEVADRLALQRSGTHRLLSSLCGLGWVEQDADTEFYRLTLKLPAMGYRFLLATEIPDVCQPILDRLAHASKELVRLATLTDGHLTTISHAQGAQGSLVCQSRLFPILPLHVTASGKAWLSTLPKEEALRLVLQAGFGTKNEFGPRALRSIDALQKELALTARRGYGVAMEEAEPGVASVACIIRPNGPQVVGCLAVVAPAFRLTQERIPEVAALAQAAAADLAMVWPLRAMADENTRPLRLAAS
jgi:IclR family transcriptional regulator, acetate operon repressor